MLSNKLFYKLLLDCLHRRVCLFVCQLLIHSFIYPFIHSYTGKATETTEQLNSDCDSFLVFKHKSSPPTSVFGCVGFNAIGGAFDKRLGNVYIIFFITVAVVALKGFQIRFLARATIFSLIKNSGHQAVVLVKSSEKSFTQIDGNGI